MLLPVLITAEFYQSKNPEGFDPAIPMMQIEFPVYQTQMPANRRAFVFDTPATQFASSAPEERAPQDWVAGKITT